MGVEEACYLLGVAIDATAEEIGAAFRLAAIRLDLADPTHALRLERLADARNVLIERLTDTAGEAAVEPAEDAESEPVALEEDWCRASDEKSRTTDTSALRDFLSATVIHEHAGAPLPDALVRWAALAATATIAWGAVAIPLRPHGHWSHILYVFGDQAAWIAERSQNLAGGFIALGVVLFATSFLLLGVRQMRGRYWAAAHIGLGTFAALPGAAVLSIILLNGGGILIGSALALAGLCIVLVLAINGAASPNPTEPGPPIERPGDRDA